MKLEKEGLFLVRYLENIADPNNHWSVSYHCLSEEEIVFYNRSECLCVCMVDMVKSTEIISQITDPLKIRKYYTIFLNSMASIAKSFGAKIVKNVDDSSIFYFPETANPGNRSAFRSVIKCGLTMLESYCYINKRAHADELPAINYRISADYGRMEVARSMTSTSLDLFGFTMNLCCNIISVAISNGMVVGNALYKIIKSQITDEDGYYLELELVGI